MQDILYNLSVATSEEELPTVNFTVKELKTLLYILEECKQETKKEELKKMIEEFQEKIKKEI